MNFATDVVLLFFSFYIQFILVNEFMFIKKNAEAAVKCALDGRQSIFDDCLSVTLCARSALCARLAATWSSLMSCAGRQKFTGSSGDRDMRCQNAACLGR